MKFPFGHYDFTALKNKPARKNKPNQIFEICLWEYGRECKSLIEAVASLKSAVAALTGEKAPALLALHAYSYIPGTKFVRCPEPQIADRANCLPAVDRVNEAVATISKIVPRFNWGIFCSADF